MLVHEIRSCADCGGDFASIMHKGVWTRRCPTCADIAQKRPSVCRSRRVVAGPYRCIIESLPGEWQPFETGQHDDRGVYRIIVKGSEFGAVWEGRLDIYSKWPFQKGELIELVEIEAEHQVLAIRGERPTSPLTQIKGGPATVPTREKIAPKQHLHDMPEAVVEEIELHRYIRLQKSARGVEPPTEEARLVYRVTKSKTTIKGYGRQYGAHLEGNPLWQKQVSGGCRSGRIHHEAALAIVDAEHPLEVVQDFDYQGGKSEFEPI